MVLEGDATAVTNEDGVVDQAAFTIRVLAKPEAIPNELTIDISEMVMGDSVRAGDLELPEGVELAGDPDELVASTSIRVIEIEEPEVDEELEVELDEDGQPIVREDADEDAEQADADADTSEDAES